MLSSQGLKCDRQLKDRVKRMDWESSSSAGNENVQLQPMESTILCSALYNTVFELTFTFAGLFVSHQCSTKSFLTHDTGTGWTDKTAQPSGAASVV